MLADNPLELLKDILPEPMEITFEDAGQVIKKINSHICRIEIGKSTKEHGYNECSSKVITVKVFHYNDGILGEYKIIPEISISPSGQIHHIMKSIYRYGNMPHEIIIHTEKKNSGIRCIDLRIFGIMKSVWGPKDEVKEIIETIDLVTQAKQTIIDRLNLDGISVY